MRVIHPKSLCLLVILTMLVMSISARRFPDAAVCDSDVQCSPPYTTCRGGYCEHKGVFPILGSEFVTAIIVLITIGLGNAVGIGGGAIIVTACYVLLRMTFIQSVAVANMTIFWAMFSGFLVHYTHKHPLKNATLVDYWIVQCQLPLIGLGTFIGSQVNEWLPDLVMSIFLFLLLLFITFQSVMKGIAMMNKEDVLILRQGELYQERAERIKQSRKDAARNARNSLNASSRLSLLESGHDNHTGINASIASDGRDSIALKISNMEEINIDKKVPAKQGVVDFGDEDIPPLDLLEAIGAEKADYSDDEINPTLEGIFYGEQNHITIDKALLVAFPVLTITLITVFRGSKSLKSIIGIERWNAVDFVLFGIEVLILLVFSCICLFLLKKNHTARKQAGYKFVRGDIEWDEAQMVAFALLAFVGGFATGAVGLSTEVLLTPFYIKMGVMPSVAGVTSQYLGMWATLSGSILYSIMGYMHFEFGFWLGFFAIIGTVFGSEAVGAYIGRRGKLSMVMWVIAFLAFVSLLAEGATAIQRAIGKKSTEVGNIFYRWWQSRTGYLGIWRLLRLIFLGMLCFNGKRP